jgi:hypothetical protein
MYNGNNRNGDGIVRCLIWMDAKVLLEQRVGGKKLVYSFTKIYILWISVFAYMHGVFPNKRLTFHTHTHHLSDVVFSPKQLANDK